MDGAKNQGRAYRVTFVKISTYRPQFEGGIVINIKNTKKVQKTLTLVEI